jgi:hypothetical protein
LLALVRLRRHTGARSIVIYAAVTLRIEIPLFIVVGCLAPMAALDIVGWFCWVPNLILIELWMRRRRAASQLNNITRGFAQVPARAAA